MNAQPTDRSEPATPTPFERFERLLKTLVSVPKEEMDARRAEYEREKVERKKRG